MDKPNKGHTIKIRLNGENKISQEEPQKRELEARIKPVSKVIKINRNVPEADGFLETAVAQESIDESFEWIIPESSENDIEEFKVVSHEKMKKNEPKKLTSVSTNFIKKNHQPVGSILISATFAILIGLTIGVIMLKLVITESGDKAATEPKVVEEKGKETTASASKTTTATIKQFTTFVIQGGYYTSKDGAKEVSNQLAAKGIPSQFIEMNGKYYIFLGVADSIEMAKSLASQNKESGVEGAFAKPLLLEEKKISDITKQEKSFLEAVLDIYQTLSVATTDALLTKGISEESSKAIVSFEEQLKKSTIKTEKVKALQTELTSVDEKVKVFQKSKDTKSLAEAQQHLLNFLSLYYSL
ncbi:hypothetical protein BACCIP111895_03446 [Neobacillus rhizosphaerae]|uniref:SPOR domain-containing protein n=1 Tax=Neobacillus rhizosphaerae TaxID=2880965 RepID=A0ABN8KUX7_9BACI|nr:SPOR domain-containing protein [Neobacillus rhizosphaerae]CAH2716262.1 hypothetical protein BACCIP111895_03446 [Neobacillus rhizosphaerae]